MTDKNLSKYYKVSEKTLYNWKSGTQELRRRYEALKYFYILNHGDIEDKIRLFAERLQSDALKDIAEQ